MSDAVTSSQIPGVAELMSLGWSSTVPILKRASNGTHQAKDTPYAYISKCIFSSSNYKNLSMDNA